MKWHATIRKLQQAVQEELNFSSLPEEGKQVLYRRLSEVQQVSAPLEVFSFVKGKENIFPGDLIFAAAALLHLENAIEAGHVRDLGMLTYCLMAGTWAATMFLGTKNMKSAILKFGDMAEMYDQVVEQRKKGGRNSKEMKELDRSARNALLKKEASQLRKKHSKRRAAVILTSRFKVSFETIRKIID